MKWFFILSFFISLMGCSRDNVLGKKTVEERFDDPNVVQLIYAGLDEDIPSMRQWLAKGADINAIGEGNVTPLVWLTTKHKRKGVAFLLDMGADPHQPITKSYSMMSLVVGGNKTSMLKVYLKHAKVVDGRTPKGDPLVVVAAFNSRWKHLEMLVEAGADINGHHLITDETAPIISTALGDIDKVPRMLELGFNYNLEDLAESVQGNYVSRGCDAKMEVVKMLEERGVRFPVKSNRKIADDCSGLHKKLCHSKSSKETLELCY